jgi:hypothetical protein
MLKKRGRWYADWEDPHGKRFRKSFPTKHQALRHQDKMRKETAAKKARASAPSPIKPTRGPRRTARRRKSTAAGSSAT